jgi:nitroreductase
MMNETLKTLHSLRSIHGDFSDREIVDEDLQAILDASVRAANASARQSYSIVVVEDRDVMRQLCGYAGSNLLLFCVDYNRLTATAEHLGHTYTEGGVVSFVTGSTDTILAAQTAAIAAKSLGIDSLFTNGIHRGDMSRVYKLLDLPEKLCFPLIALVLGYPSKEPAYQKGRWVGPGVIHYGTYHPITAEEIDALIQRCDDPEAHLTLSDAWKDKGFAHYHDWFFKVWIGRGGPKAGKSQMLELLERAGFAE